MKTLSKSAAVLGGKAEGKKNPQRERRIRRFWASSPGGGRGHVDKKFRLTSRHHRGEGRKAFVAWQRNYEGDVNINSEGRVWGGGGGGGKGGEHPNQEIASKLSRDGEENPRNETSFIKDHVSARGTRSEKGCEHR